MLAVVINDGWVQSSTIKANLEMKVLGNGSFYHSLYVWDWDISTYAMQDQIGRAHV